MTKTTKTTKPNKRPLAESADLFINKLTGKATVDMDAKTVNFDRSPVDIFYDLKVSAQRAILTALFKDAALWRTATDLGDSSHEPEPIKKGKKPAKVNAVLPEADEDDEDPDGVRDLAREDDPPVKASDKRRARKRQETFHDDEEEVVD